MKHIKLFETFNEVPDSMRDLFGLTAKLEVYEFWGEWAYVIEGPTESEEEARIIGDKISDIFQDREGYYYAEPGDVYYDDTDKGDIDDFMEDVVEKQMNAEKEALAKIGWEIYWEPRGDESEEEV
jgi:hypothetical protein